ncbi:Glycosyl hydrolases family 2, sugar binding domain [Poriferisphaera corsica]|uniref:Glycosyl hydrolases family 2, sugar binding domain n=1 Tax=Poriferisphaera corsica TaxID=2528020 RepID=A0A517YY61_9BACT|nr:sialate O-acetylesterase [Poriferisphaera corsica]QDU35173.1 Glycosyl hydrolases family 2, sugar binding domain [Poriferisphaera corsica]
MNTPFKTLRFLPALLLLLTISLPAFAQSLSVASIISDHMMLQRNTTCPIWGKAKPYQNITVTIDDQTHTTTTNINGKWRINLKPISTKGPFTLTITSPDQTLTITDVITGEVWLGSGQSNMEWSVRSSNNAEQEQANAQYPDIRIFTVKHQANHSDEILDPNGQWESVTPKSIEHFSAVAYFFGRKIHQELNTPVGLIDSSWGGTPAQSWTPIHALRQNSKLNRYVKTYDQKRTDWAARIKDFNANQERYQQIQKTLSNAPDNQGAAKGYHTSDFNDSDWETTNLPVKYAEINSTPDINGVLWVRTSVELPSQLQNKQLTLNLGVIDDYDLTYVNGQIVGQIGKENSRASGTNRKYTIPASVNNKPTLTIAVRVVDTLRTGGFKSGGHNFYLTNDSDKIRIDKNDWKYKFAFIYTKETPGRLDRDIRLSISGLYNGMIQPLIPYAIKGVLWYQGESNNNGHTTYEPLLTSLITSWREAWDQPINKDFPFLIVQLPNYREPSKKVEQHSWAHLREAQRLTHAKLPNTGLATIIDIGDTKNIHPRNKQDVGLRLAYWALAETYNKPITPAGPLFTHQTINKDNSITLHFKYADGIKPLSGDKLSGFFISSNGRSFAPATAIINPDNTITVSHPSILNPKVVAYGFASNPEKMNLNLTNDSNIPASPFLSSN